MKKRLLVLLFMAGIMFWPLFAVFTVLEERGGVAWLHTESMRVWLPVAVLAFLSVVISPFVSDMSAGRKAVSAVFAVLAYAATFALILSVGASFLGWDD